MLEKLGDPLEQVLDLLNISDIVSVALVSEEWFNAIYVFRKKLRKRILTEASILYIEKTRFRDPKQWCRCENCQDKFKAKKIHYLIIQGLFSFVY